MPNQKWCISSSYTGAIAPTICFRQSYWVMPVKAWLPRRPLPAGSGRAHKDIFYPTLYFLQFDRFSQVLCASANIWPRMAMVTAAALQLPPPLLSNPSRVATLRAREKKIKGVPKRVWQEKKMYKNYIPIRTCSHILSWNIFLIGVTLLFHWLKRLNKMVSRFNWGKNGA